MNKTAKRVVVTLVFVVGIGYFTFSQMIYNPFEGSYMDQFEGAPEVAVEYVVPREVDFFAHKRGLARDYAGGNFPLPDLWEEIRLSRSFRHFSDSPFADRLATSMEISSHIDRIRSAVEEIPMLDVVEDVIGTDFGVFGRVKGFGYETAEVAAVFLGSDKMRFAYSATMSPLLRSLFGMPVEVSEVDGVTELTLPSGDKVYTHRHLDLFVVSTGPNLIREVQGLLDLGETQSLGYSRGYHATVAQDVENFAGRKVVEEQRGPAVDRRIQLHARTQPLLSLTTGDEELLEHRGELSRWLLAKLFNPRYFQALTLDLGMQDAVELRGTLGFDRQLAEAAHTGFYNRPTFGLKKAMDEVASLLPEDTFFVMAARVDIKQFLPQIVDGLREVDPAAVSLIDELIAAVRKTRPDFRSTNAQEAVRNFASFLGDDVVIALKRDSYFGAPVHPLPLVCFFFEVTDRGLSFDELKKSNGDPAKAQGYNGYVYPIMASHSQLKAKTASVANWFNVWHGGQGTPNERAIQEVILAQTEDVKNVAFGIVDPASKAEKPWRLAMVLSPHVESLETKKADGKTAFEDYGTAQEMITDVIQLQMLSLMNVGKSPEARIGATEVVDASKSNKRVVKPLVDSAKYRQDSGFLDRFASIAMFVDATGLKSTLEDQADIVAEMETAIDWPKEIPRLTEELMAESYEQYRGKTMPDAVKRKFDSELLAKREDLHRANREVAFPQARERYLQSLSWVDMIEDAFLAARIDDKEQIIELGARVRLNLK